MGIHRTYSGTLTRAAATVSGSEVVAGLGGKPKYVIFNTIDGATIFSQGVDDGVIAFCSRTNTLGSLSSQTQSIHAENSTAAGHRANISSMNADGFTLNWTRIGIGLNVTVKYIAIM